MSKEVRKDSEKSALESGDYGRAKELYGQLLESFPDSVEYACGFYSSGYWANRTDTVKNTRKGRTLAVYYMGEWDKFQTLAAEKNLLETETFRTVMKSVLGKAADQFRLAYQEEGGSVDRNLLLDLGRCLLKIEDYRNASDILNYARRVAPQDAKILFLLAESLLSQKSEEAHLQGIACYRDAFIIHPESFDATLVASLPMSRIFKMIRPRYESIEQALLWLPAYFMLDMLKAGVRQMSQSDFKGLKSETARLLKDIPVTGEKFLEKVRSRAAFYLTIIYYHVLVVEENSSAAREMERELNAIEPALMLYAKSRRDESP